MPLCFLHTNTADIGLKEGIENRIAVNIAETLKKPLERVIVVVSPGVRIFTKGSTEPSCVFVIHSIGVFDKERNPGYTKSIKEMLMKELDLTEERISIMYDDLDKDMIG